MNRREAIAALVSLPEVARIATVPASTDDVIVVECDGLLTDETRARIVAQLKDVWPDRQIIVCNQDVRIKVVPK